LQPSSLFESPALNPKPACFPLEFNGNGWEKRKASMNNEGNEFGGPRKLIEDGILEEYRSRRTVKREMIREIKESNEEQEEEEKSGNELDCDGFKIPKVCEKLVNEAPRESLKCSISLIGKPNTQATSCSSQLLHEVQSKFLESEDKATLSPIMLTSPYFTRSPAPQKSNPSSSQLMSQNPYCLPRDFSLDSCEQQNQMPPEVQAQEIERVETVLSSIATQPTLSLPIIDQNERLIGSLTRSQRREKIRKYLEKRKRRIWRKKICYDCRKKMADKRLRIKGRFVTREQACALLGTTEENLSSNEMLKSLVNSNSNCSIITSAHNMRIRNIQTLFTPATGKRKEIEGDIKAEAPQRQDIKVEILKSSANEQTVEIKIEAIDKKKGSLNKQEQHVKIYNLNSSDMYEMPFIQEPVFQLHKIKIEESNSKHKRFHKDQTVDTALSNH
jgi:hypothetical protein